MQFEARDSQNIGYHPRIRGNSRIFRDADLFFFFFGFHPRIRGISRIFRDKDLGFLVHTFEFEVIKFWPPKKKTVYASPVTLLWRRACFESRQLIDYLYHFLLGCGARFGSTLFFASILLTALLIFSRPAQKPTTISYVFH